MASWAPAGRFAEPEEIAATVAFLASSGAFGEIADRLLRFVRVGVAGQKTAAVILPGPETYRRSRKTCPSASCCPGARKAGNVHMIAGSRGS
jgi:hypothetical protein